MEGNRQLLERLVFELKNAYYLKTGKKKETVTWATSAYEDLKAEYLKEGITIGFQTIRSIMDFSYKINSSRQKVNTLSKVVQYIGYRDWQAFLDKEQNPHNEDQILNTVLEANRAIIIAYQKIPTVYSVELQKYFIPSSLFFKKLRMTLVSRSYAKFELSGNSAHYTLNAEIKFVSNRKAAVMTTEISNILWEDPGGKTYKQKEGNKEYYIVVLFYNGAKWKIEGKYKILHDEEKKLKPYFYTVNSEPIEVHGLWFKPLFTDYFIEF